MAENLVISDTLPAGANYVSGGTLVGDVVRWTAPSLNARTFASVQFVVTANQTITNADYRVRADGGIQAVGQQVVVTRIGGSVSKGRIYLPLVLRE